MCLKARDYGGLNTFRIKMGIIGALSRVKVIKSVRILMQPYIMRGKSILTLIFSTLFKFVSKTKRQCRTNDLVM